jgi:hypothetical protein
VSGAALTRFGWNGERGGEVAGGAVAGVDFAQRRNRFAANGLGDWAAGVEMASGGYVRRAGDVALEYDAGTFSFRVRDRGGG